MHSGTPHRSSLLLAKRVVLLLALAAATLAVAQRSLVGDRPTSVRVVPVALSGDCVKRCNDTFVKTLQGEYTLHKNVVRFVCGGNFVCHKDENYRHHAALQAIVASHKACKNGCTTQGDATAGL
jgi:hypothetical protein